MNDMVYNSRSLTGIAAAVTSLLGVEKPEMAEEAAPELLQISRGKTLDRVFLYNPDAVAMWLYQKYTELFLPLLKHISLTLPLRSVMPPVTPVCFGTMYTGSLPEVHGIRTYAKPIIRIDTVMDALIRAGKKPALVSTKGDSLSLIYLERQMDYYIYDTVEEVNAKALELIAEDRYDFYIVYNGDYDAAMHRSAPEGEASIQVLKKNIAVFDRFACAIEAQWEKHDTLIAFAPDHGCHEIDGGLGSHGLEMPEDLNILHFYGYLQARTSQ